MRITALDAEVLSDEPFVALLSLACDDLVLEFGLNRQGAENMRMVMNEILADPAKH